MSQSFPLDKHHLAGYGGKSSPAEHEPTGKTSKSVQKPTYFFLSLLCRHSCLLHLGIPLIISSRTSIWVCISVVFNSTQDGSDCLSVSYSAPHEMAEFVSLYQPHLHIRCQYLPLWSYWTPYKVVVFASLEFSPDVINPLWLTGLKAPTN